MDRLPRYMPFSNAAQELSSRALERMLENADFHDEFARVLKLLCDMVRLTPTQDRALFTTASSVPELLTRVSYLSSGLKQHCDEFCSGMQRLMVLVERNEQNLYFIWGKFLHELLTVGLYRNCGMEIPAGWGRYIFHLEPGNPIERTSNKGIFHQEDATPAQRKTLEQFFDSLQPQGKPGPDVGSTSRPPDFPDRVRKGYETTLNAQNSDPFIGVEDIMETMQHRGKRTFERWLKESTGFTWKPFKRILDRWLKEAPELTWEQIKKTL